MSGSLDPEPSWRARCLRGLLLAVLALCACRSSDEIAGLKTEILDSPDRFQLEFEGVRAFSKGLLQRAASNELDDFVATEFSAPPIDDAAYVMANFYKSRGFPFAEVEYEIERPQGKEPRVRFRVEEGPRCRLESVTFEGNRNLDRKQLESLIGGPTTQMFGLGQLYFVGAEAEAARSAIENLYYQQGYIDVAVEGPDVSFDKSRRGASLQYSIREGPRYAIRSIEFADDAGQDLERIRERMAPYLGRAYFPRLAYEIGAAAADVMANRGFPDARVQSTESVDRETGEVRLSLSLLPGAEVRLGEIRVQGNERTRGNFIRRTLGFESGDLYRRIQERRGFRELYASGLFDSITVDLVGQGEVRDLLITVEEAETLSVYGEVGYGSFERARVLFGISERNFLGTARSLRFEGKLAERARGASLFFKDPYTIDKDNVLGATTFAEQRKLPSFDSLEYGANISLTRHLTRKYRNVYGYEYRISEASDVQAQLPGSTEVIQGDVGISALYLTNAYDSRDGFFMPRKGLWARLRTEFAPEFLESELTFVKLDGRVVQYLPIDEGSVLAWTLRMGAIAPIGNSEEVPLQERFYNGGQNTVRSFREDELGPTDASDNQIGGEAFSVISMEYRYDLPASFSAALFVDAGNVSLRYEDAFAFKDMRYAYGPGLRWLLPIGPLRLDWGINPRPRRNESDWVLQFSLGIAF